jgi:hypothetical protein
MARLHLHAQAMQEARLQGRQHLDHAENKLTAMVDLK